MARTARKSPHIEEQKIQALRWWMSGAKYRAIADMLGIGTGTAYKRVQDALDDMRPHAEFDKYRGTQLAELEVTRIILRRIIAAFGTPTGLTPTETYGAIDRLLKLQEREAKLLGLDRVSTPIDELTGMTDEQMAEMLADWANQARVDLGD